MDTEKTVGTLLREARLAKGLSLAEAEQATSIRARYLEAIEKDEYEKTPGEVFLKGMLRNYGNFLGLDGLELVHMYKASAVGKPKDAVKSTGIREVDKVKLNIQLKNPRDVGSGTGKLELPKLPSIDMRQVLAGVAVLVVLAGGYFAIPKAIDYFQNRPQAVAAVEKKEEPSAKKPAAAWDKVQVNLEATGDCWLEVQAEGKEIFAGMLKAKDKKTFETKEKLIVKYGNIGVVKIVFNGEPVDLQGQHGVQVKTYTLQGTQDESKYAPPAKPEAQGSVQEKTEPTEAKADKAEAGAAKPAEPVKSEAKAEKVETVEAKPAEAKPVEAKQ
ncbi:MAG: helix-turn-helix domain-containing protein [Phascolarctobacterium sp.]